MSRQDAFVWLVGQDDNIGDVVLRRPLLDRLRRHARLHLFVGAASDGFLHGLRLAADDVLYRGDRSWHARLRRRALSPGCCIAFRPGETSLSRSKLRQAVRLLPPLAIVRLTGGPVLNLGLGVHHDDRWAAVPMQLILRTAQLNYWRDPDSCARMGFGAVMPDWAFAEGDPDPAIDAPSRSRLVVSLRGDLPPPTPEWCAAIRRCAQRHALAPVVVTQVRRDGVRARQLATELDAELCAWDDATDHLDQETRLRAIYRDARLAISDRLHVLILAMTEGAMPCGLTENPRDKISRHFAAVGLGDIGRHVGGASPPELDAALDATLAGHARAMDCLHAARRQLAAVTDELDALLRRAPR